MALRLILCPGEMVSPKIEIFDAAAFSGITTNSPLFQEIHCVLEI